LGNRKHHYSRKGAKHAKFGEKGKEKMSLQVKRENVPEKKVVLKTGEGEGSMIIRQAFGNESSLLVALRPPGYHTRPHMHASEQINHVLEGEIWFFVEDRGYHCLKGDFHRIPANRVHWAWNRSNATTAVVESHSPPLVGGELRGGGSLRELIQAIPRVTDRGIQAVLEDLASLTAVPKQLIDRPDYFRDNGPLEKLVASGWIEQLRK
jgi:quercetin dioxygenase-like cupin family protein